jgi:uncharacterized membrane protein YidH (DUF202 family)
MSDVKQCPFCAEDIKAEAIKCKHCGEMLKQAMAEKKKAAIAEQVAAGVPFDQIVTPPVGTVEAGEAPEGRTTLAALLFLVGIVVFGYGMAMDTTVATAVGRVANIHLGQQQNMYLIVGALAVAGGFGVVYADKNKK